MWKVLCEDFFQRYVDKDQAVLDMGAGCCEFINAIVCRKKYALDADSGVIAHAAAGVTPLIGSGRQASELLQGVRVDVVFMCNFLEHLQSKDELTETLREVLRILTDGGRLLILQPNIRYCSKQYWDFFDHNIALSHLSLQEILRFVGFELCQVKPKFLPYTTKSRLPLHPLLVKAYLLLPPAQWIMGKQMFVVARKAG